MKNRILSVAAVLAACMLIQLSCNKTGILQPDPRNGNTDYKLCAIQEFNGSGGGAQYPYRTRSTIFYNERKDPIRVEQAADNGTPDMFYYYDGKHRLITYAGVYGNGAFEFWHNYFYDRTGRITGDSMYVLGPVGNLPYALEKRYFRIGYDRLDRVNMEIRTTNLPGYPNPDTLRYAYDVRGNLVIEGANYDDKVNPLLTNKIWRFIARDYSVNNPTHAHAYNDRGLPVLFTPAETGYFNPGIWGVFGDSLSIQYDCVGEK